MQNIEVLKDGASSIYGSDAVAGVVNIITKKDAGAEIDFFYNGTEEGGGEQLRASGTYSKDFSRGNFLVSVDYTKREELARGDRDYLSCGQSYIFDTTGQRADLIDPRTGNFQCRDLLWGHVWMYNYLDAASVGRPWQARPQLLQYDYDGSLASNGLAPWGPNDFGLILDPNWFPVGLSSLLAPGATPDPFYGPTAELSEALLNYNHPFVQAQTLNPEIERTTFFASGDYELTKNMTMYGEVLLNRRETKVNGYRQFWQYDAVLNIFGDVFTYFYEPYAPGTAPGEAHGFVYDPSTFSFIGMSPTPITDRNKDAVRVDYVNAVLGMKGDFAVPGWKWDVFAQFSQSDGRYESDVIFDDAISPYAWFVGTPCGPNDVTPVRGVPCRTPDWYNPQFLAGNISPEDQEFLFGVDVGSTTYEQAQIEAFLDGPLFEMPAGTVTGGIGFSRIRERINDVPGEAVRSGNVWGSTAAGITRGAKVTRAVFGEVSVPLVKDAPLAKAVDMSLSARFTDVDVYGSDTTYKVGLGWQITDTVRARTTYGTSFRAPALFELFLADQLSFQGQRFIDPCINWGPNLANGNISQRRADNCAADGILPTHSGAGGSASIFARGNAGELKAETSEAFNLGVVWAPTFADLRVSLDYFEFKIEDQITQYGAANILALCYESDNFANEPFCDLFTRNPNNNNVQRVQNDFVNIADQTNRGIDLAAQYSRDFSFGTMTLNTQHTFQMDDKFTLFAGSNTEDTNGEIGDPKWVGEASLTLDRGPWSFFWGTDFIGKADNYDSYGGNSGTVYGNPVTFKLETETTIYHNASISRELPHGVDIRVGVANIFDEAPPSVTTLNLGEFNSIGTAPFVSQYDWFGRRFFVNVKKTF